MSYESINLEPVSNVIQDFRIRYITVSKYENDWPSLLHTHQCSELFYVLNGKGVIYVEDDVIPVEPNDIIIINPHVEHTEKTLPSDPMEYIVFGIDELAFAFSDPCNDSFKGYSFYHYDSEENPYINAAQLMIREFREKESGFEIICHGLLQILLTYIARAVHLSIISDSTFQLSKECALAKRYIDANYSKNITLDVLAEITHINKFYLAHSFTECMGKSPIQYLTEKRLDASRQLLSRSDLSVAQIASSVGFGSQSYFSQLFKKKIGMTPQKYRKWIASQNGNP